MSVLDDLRQNAPLRLGVSKELVLDENEPPERLASRVHLREHDVHVVDLCSEDDQLGPRLENAGFAQRVRDGVSVRTDERVDVLFQEGAITGVDSVPCGPSAAWLPLQ